MRGVSCGLLCLKRFFLCSDSSVFLGGGKVQDMVSLCMPGCPCTPFVDKAVLEFGDLPASLVVGLKAGATLPSKFTFS